MKTLAALILVFAATLAAPMSAEAVLILGVTYSDGSIDSGPLSFGLAALPTTVDATFTLGDGTPGIEPGELNWGLGDVQSASISFGDGTWTQLTSFSLQTINGIFNALVYEFASITTASAVSRPILNFPLSITGTDTNSGEDFEYGYTSSTQTLTTVPEPGTLGLLGAGLLGLYMRRKRVA